MGLQELFIWRSQTAAQTTNSMPAVSDEDLAADVDEPPEHGLEYQKPDFHRSLIRQQSDRKVSLLTKALQHPEVEERKPVIHIATDMSRRRSMMSNASIASTAELTSDGGFTSPARTNTPSPPFPSTPYTSFAPYSLAAKSANPAPVRSTAVVIKDSVSPHPEIISASPKTQPATDAVPKKRCITFACVGRRTPVAQPSPPAVTQTAPAATQEAPRRT